ncbi:MAG: hypothetical protein F4X34_07465 [Chloroflexi bacterium]|nr:hypothetical protein [Chloroflexota bacterium]
MDNLKNPRCKVSVYIASGQEDLSEKRILEGPKSIFFKAHVDGDVLLSKIRSKIGDPAHNEESVEYTLVLTDLIPPGSRPSSWPRYYGTIYFAKNVSVPEYIYGEGLLSIISDVLEVKESPLKIYGIERIPKGGRQVTNEQVNQIREEMGI